MRMESGPWSEVAEDRGSGTPRDRIAAAASVSDRGSTGGVGIELSMVTRGHPGRLAVQSQSEHQQHRHRSRIAAFREVIEKKP